MLKSQSPKTSESGFTLLEIIVVVFIIGLLAAVAVPGIRSWKSNADLNGDMRRLYGFFQRARLEAVKQNINCSVTFNQVDENGTTFSYAAFIDPNGNNEYEPGAPAPNTESILVSGDFTPGVTMVLNNLPENGAGLDTATFDNRGLIAGDNGAAIMGARIRLQSSGGLTRDLVFNRHGRMRIE